MELIDTHCHLDFPQFDPDRAQVLSRSRAAGVGAIVIPGVTAHSWPKLLELCAREQDLFPALGLHPLFTQDHRAQHLDQLATHLTDNNLIAIGEIGLDFAHPNADSETQLWYFKQQLQLAAKHQLPVLLHVRKAHDAALACLNRARVPGGIAHAFNGSLQQAHAYLKLGFKLGFGGMLTYARSTKLRRLARNLPIEAIVLETDAPDLTVASHQYRRNSPEYLPEVLNALAELRAEHPAQLARHTTRNAQLALGLASVAGRYGVALEGSVESP